MIQILEGTYGIQGQSAHLQNKDCLCNNVTFALQVTESDTWYVVQKTY